MNIPSAFSSPDFSSAQTGGRPAAHFARLYAESADPWHAVDSWYEQRKRAILLALLPKPHFSHICEPGCGNGELTLELARRCERLTASDFCDQAVQIAREKSAALAHVEILQQSVPEQWWSGAVEHPQFDLIVLSEFCYYLTADQTALLAAKLMDSLSPQGYLLACHWKRPFDDRLQETDAIHAALGQAPDLRQEARYEDADFVLDLWMRAPLPAAARPS
jgi:SAM-dependent methyltransferase